MRRWKGKIPFFTQLFQQTSKVVVATVGGGSRTFVLNRYVCYNPTRYWSLPLTHDRTLMNINYREREGERNPTGHGWGFWKEEETACNFFLMHSPKIFTSCGRPSLHWLVSRNNTLVVWFSLLLFSFFFWQLFFTVTNNSLFIYLWHLWTNLSTLPFPPACRPFRLIRFWSHEARISNQFLWIVVVFFCCLSLIELLVIDRSSS